MAQHEGDLFGGADIREPIPREHALRGDDEILPVRGHHVEQGLRRRRHIAVHEHLAGGVEDAHVHGLHVEIDPAIVTMLAVVESHFSSPPARMRAYPALSLLTTSRCAGGGLNKSQALAADERRGEA